MSEDLAINKTKTRIVKTENEEKAIGLMAEIREFFSQYSREVKKSRKPWPESIKKRVLELWEMGISTHQIGTEAEFQFKLSTAGGSG